MKGLVGFLIILLCLLAGNLVSGLLALPIPGSIFGMVFLLALLMTRAVRLETVEPAAGLLVSLLILLLIPGTVDIMANFHKLAGAVPQLVLIVVVSTALVILVTGRTAQSLIRLKEKKNKEAGDGDA
ncbi:MAG: CidA/LrgA family protein [Clostridiales bacterium]|nr:CidA/LrgA family protein [Clostridiales bacterium]